MICHVATFKMKDEEAANEAVTLLTSLSSIVPGTVMYKVEKNIKNGPCSADVCLIGVFENDDVFSAYMCHPQHTKEVAPALFKLSGVDYRQAMTSCDFEIDTFPMV